MCYDQQIKETLDKLYSKYGTLEDDFKAATGYGLDALTQSEARYLAYYKPAVAVRTCIIKERDARINSRNAPPDGVAYVYCRTGSGLKQKVQPQGFTLLGLFLCLEYLSQVLMPGLSQFRGSA